MSAEMLFTARVDALAASTVSAGTVLDRAEADAAIRDAVRAHAGVRGCLAEIAYQYGERPETTAERVRWVRQTIAALYGMTSLSRAVQAAAA